MKESNKNENNPVTVITSSAGLNGSTTTTNGSGSTSNSENQIELQVLGTSKSSNNANGSGGATTNGSSSGNNQLKVIENPPNRNGSSSSMVGMVEQSNPIVNRVSEWFDADSYKVFMRTVRSGDILEVRNTRSSHWGIAIRLKQPPSPPKGNGGSPKPVPDEVMVYHLIHSSQHRGQVGQFTLEEFWQPDCKIRINNTTNGSCIFGNSPTIPKSDVLNNALYAHLSTSLKWQTCTDFIRWSSIYHNNY